MYLLHPHSHTIYYTFHKIDHQRLWKSNLNSYFCIQTNFSLANEKRNLNIKEKTL